jgi:hypothetical protein
MPYGVRKKGRGYKVVNLVTGRTYSKKTQTKKQAVKQLRAIEIHTHGR